MREKVHFEDLGADGPIILTVIGSMSCGIRQRVFFQLHQDQRRAQIDAVLDGVAGGGYLRPFYLMVTFEI